MNNDQLKDLITNKMASAEEVHSGWIVAWLMMDMLQVLHRIERQLSGDDQVSHHGISAADRLMQISSTLANILDVERKRR